MPISEAPPTRNRIIFKDEGHWVAQVALQFFDEADHAIGVKDKIDAWRSGNHAAKLGQRVLSCAWQVCEYALDSHDEEILHLARAYRAATEHPEASML